MKRQTYMFMVLGAASIALYAFGGHTIYTLMAGSLGLAAMVIASISGYRPGIILGMLVIVTSASVSSPLDTMTEVGAVLTAAVGYFIPVAAVIWFALSTGVAEEARILRFRWPAIVTGIFAAACLMSVPLAVGLVSLLSAQVAVRFSVLEEIAIISVVASIGAIILSSREPKMVREYNPPESAE